MIAFVLRRTVGAVLLVLAVSSAAFVLTRLAPGDAAEFRLGLGASQEAIARARREAGLDRPLGAQYVEWLRRLATFDAGRSVLYNRPVGPLVRERARNTALLAACALSVALATGIGLALATASRPRTVAARAVRAGSLVCVSLPPFITSLALVWVAARTGWFPAGGLPPAAADGSLAAWLVSLAWHLPLPALALAIPLAGTFERVQGQALAEALGSPAVQAARARGYSPAAIVRRHAWRLSIKPVAALGGLAFGALLSGSFAVEMVTAWPGLGRLTFDALRARDLDLVAGCATAGALVLSAGLLLADLVAAWSDPRVRESGGGGPPR